MVDFRLILRYAWQQVGESFGSGPYKSPITSCPFKAIVGTAWRDAAKIVFPGHQHYQNCGVQSARQIVEQASGQPLPDSELEFLNKAIDTCGVEKEKNHPKDSGGSDAGRRQCILKQYGVASKIEDASLENVDRALRDGKGVIISADVAVLWQHRPGVPPQTVRHAVVVTHGHYDQDGNLAGVWVNDTGIGQRYFLTTEQLGDALDSGSLELNITDHRIWPNN